MRYEQRRHLGVLTICLALFPEAARSQTVQGRVVEEASRTTVEGAMVELIGADGVPAAQALTDTAGVFSVRAGGAGVFQIRLSHPSFTTLSSDTIPLGPGEVVSVELRMGQRVIPLEPLVVTAQSHARLGGFYDRLRQPGFGRFLTRTDIDARRPVNRTTDLLRDQIGVEIVPVRVRGGITGQMILTRSLMGRCQPTIVLDGAPLRQLPESGIDDFLKPDMLEGVEIYMSGATAPPHLTVASNACGVIVFWTRTGSGEGGELTLKRVLTALGLLAGLVVSILVGW